MKKYKLIKEYPNSPELGYIVDDMESIKHANIVRLDDYPEFWHEVKEPLFVTEDGVEIHNGDYYYCPVFNCESSILEYRANIPSTYSKELARFSTKEAAEQWIEQNKPVFSRKQVLDAIKNTLDTLGFHFRIDEFKKELGL